MGECVREFVYVRVRMYICGCVSGMRACARMHMCECVRVCVHMRTHAHSLYLLYPIAADKVVQKASIPVSAHSASPVTASSRPASSSKPHNTPVGAPLMKATAQTSMNSDA